MNNSKKTVALIYGGAGAEHEVSLMSNEYLSRLIDRERFNVLSVLIDTDGVWLHEGERLLLCSGGLMREDGAKIPVDAAFPLLHGDLGEDGTIAGALECAGIPYVGCGVTAGAVCADKAITKLIAERLGIPTVRWILRIEDDTENIDLSSAESDCAEKIGYPMFIKPAGLGSSVGCAAVMTPGTFFDAYADAARLGRGRVLIEEFIGDRRELEIAFYSAGAKRIISHPGEVICHGPYTYEEKYSKSTHSRVCVRSDAPEAIGSLAERYSDMLCRAIGIRHLARIDFFLSDSLLYLNEINTMPGFTEASLYPRLMESEGITPEALVNSLISDCLSLC